MSAHHQGRCCTGPDAGTPHSPQTKLKAAMAGPQETFREVLHLHFSPLFSHCVKIKLKGVAKMEKSKDSGSIHDSAKGNHRVGVRKK